LPIRVLVVGPAVEVDAVVRASSDALIVEQRHGLGHDVTPAKARVHPADFGRPVAQSSHGIAVEHDRIRTRSAIKISESNRVEPTKKLFLEVWDVHVQQNVTLATEVVVLGRRCGHLINLSEEA
jgi:hypothetical protein